jgi:hypothetical protein
MEQKTPISMGENKRKYRILLSFFINLSFFKPHRLSISKLVGAK